jgi:protein-S-isoprenylcysteine O-methyltransferase Ste14
MTHLTLALKIPPVFITIISAFMMFGLSCATPSMTFLLPHHLYGSILLITIGSLIALAGVIEFKRHHTTVNPLTPNASSTMVMTGIYRFSRNPMYFGFLMILVGFAIYLCNLIAYGLLPAFVIYMNQFQIKPEEIALHDKFGQEFVAYVSTVRRWI